MKLFSEEYHNAMMNYYANNNFPTLYFHSMEFGAFECNGDNQQYYPREHGVYIFSEIENNHDFLSKAGVCDEECPSTDDEIRNFYDRFIVGDKK